MNYAAAFGSLLRSLHGLHNFWRQKTPLSPADVASYRVLATRFGRVWHGLQWKPGTWVHWVVRHSPYLADRHRNFYVFSSIPTERRNVEFKLDLTHCFKAWKLSDPSASVNGFGHCLNLSALDAGLFLHDALKRGVKRGEKDE